MIAKTGMLNWMDDFLDWQDPIGEPPCCRRRPGLFILIISNIKEIQIEILESGHFCSATAINSSDCVTCETTEIGFYDRLGYFIKDIPGEKCPKGWV